MKHTHHEPMIMMIKEEEESLTWREGRGDEPRRKRVAV